MFNADFAYHEVPIERDPIDLEAYRACPMRFTCVCTDIETGKAVYHDLPYGDEGYRVDPGVVGYSCGDASRCY